MAVAFGSAGTRLGGGTSSSGNVPVPTGVAANDIIIVIFYTENTSPTITPPAGFTEAPNSPTGITSGLVHQTRAYWKRATGNDAGTYNFTLSPSEFRDAVALRFTGCITSGNPIDVDTQTIANSGSSSPAVSLTTTQQDTMLVWAVTHWNAQTTSTPSGFTTRFASEVGGGFCAQIATKAQAAAGATGSVTTTAASGQTWNVWMGALKPQPITLLGEWGFLNNLNDTSSNGHHATFDDNGMGSPFAYVDGPQLGSRGIKFGHTYNTINYGRTGLEPTTDGVTIMGWMRIENGATANITMGLLQHARAGASSRIRVGAVREAAGAAPFSTSFQV